MDRSEFDPSPAQPEKPVTFQTMRNREYARIMKLYGLPPRAHSSKCLRVEMEPHHRRALNLQPHTPAEVEAAEAIVNGIVEQMVDFMIHEKKWPLPDNYHVVVRFDWSRHRNRSRGGRYSGRFRSYESGEKKDGGAGISLAMGAHVPFAQENRIQGMPVMFSEYKHIQNDPEIGSFMGKWEDCLRVLVIHEVAHAIQFNTAWSQDKELTAKYPSSTRGAHLKLWQDLYRIGRRQFGFVKPE